ncbi:MAG: hypothetical protein AAGG02_09990 [Cyanobacteria bacterium P01_H01_bin.15]
MASVSFAIANFLLSANSAIAQNSYPVSVRSVYLQGCLSENPPNFSNEQAAYQQIRLCVCTLDKFQARYTSQQFMELFGEADQNQSPQAQELERVGTEFFIECS